MNEDGCEGHVGLAGEGGRNAGEAGVGGRSWKKSGRESDARGCGSEDAA